MSTATPTRHRRYRLDGARGDMRAPIVSKSWLAALARLFAVLALMFGALSGAAQAQSGIRDDGLVRLDQMDGGALLFFTDEPGLYVPAPVLSTDIEIDVTGPLARAKLTQRFRNVSKVWVEGKYVFPLPENAAVDTLKMRIGDRVIEGQIKEKQQAREIYEAARDAGFKASLVEQERPNLFTNSVANIGPGETVVVQIEYQQTLAPRDGAFGLRVPLVVAPRYSPEPPVQLVKFGPKGWELNKDPVPDRDRITPPVVDPRSEEPGTIRNPVDITVRLNAGFPLGPIRSLYHEVNVSPKGTTGAEVTLSGEVPADRDFYLSWTPDVLSDPYVAMFSESVNGFDHYLMMVTPPAAERLADTRKPREVIFVQDISGSMHGESIEQARKGLEMALKRLNPEDTFNIIVFNDRYGMIADKPLAATEANIAEAVKAVRALQADGGTEMLPALEAALRDANPQDESRIRQVIFLTDGAVGNETQMLGLIEKDLGRSRLFTVGIGSAPNSYFMTAAAESGRGSHVFIGDLAEVQERMEHLFAKIENPAVTDLNLSVSGFAEPEIWPNPLPDLYAGDPVIATIRVPGGSPIAAMSRVVLEGERAGQLWVSRNDLSSAKERPGIAKLWARQRIASLEALRLSPEANIAAEEKIDAEILQTALDHHLVSRLTSLVAVDVTPSRSMSERLSSTDVPLNLPDGWSPEEFFDAPATEAMPAPVPLKATLQDRLQKAAEARTLAAAQTEEAGVPVPVGASLWILQLGFGLLLLIGAIALWIWGQRARRNHL
ncbi:MAG: marine proteobacterial sortase target protein [Neomegalonema sp.]|nr:marine proteobacterial sortase target protein [Neomegalonema sp.]